MAGEWLETTLGKVIRLQRGHDLPQPQRVPGRVPVMGSFGITGWHNAAIGRSPGVTVGRSGASIGVVSFIARAFWPLNTCLYVTDFLGNDPLFCYYWLKQQDLAAFNSGSAQPSLNRNYIYLKHVRVPGSVEEQRNIAAILGTLDNKIELNRKMNETLEAMARALFKSWFVDFDPVHAKAEGRPTGLPDHISALFPDSFESSELGDIPKGWSVAAIGEVIDLCYGKALKEQDRKAGGVAVYGSNGQVGWHNKKLVAGPGIVVGRKGNPGTVTWAAIDFFPIDTTFFVAPKEPIGSLYFLLFSLQRQNLDLLGADSAVPGLNRSSAYLKRQLVPLAPVLDAFDGNVRPLFTRVEDSKKESITLATLRDTLLPKLISGELRLGADTAGDGEIR